MTRFAAITCALLCLLTFTACIPLAADITKPAQEVPVGADLDHMLGSMLMLGFRGAALAPDDPFLAMIKDGKIGNVILFDKDVSDNSPRNIISPEQLGRLTESIKSAAGGPILIGIDQEGGQVRRLKAQKGFFDLPSAQVMGQASPKGTFDLADQSAREMAKLGINLDLAPVVDVDTNPFNPAIGRLGRAFSSDAQTVARHALAFGMALAKNGVVPTLKHFPGQGCAKEDSHLGLADISQCWNPEIDLLPYAEIFSQGWPGAVMTGHLFQRDLDNDLQATFSKKIITGLLRDGLGWQGVVISDDLQMKGAGGGRELKELMQLAIEAGVDIILLGNNLEWDPALPQKAWQTLRALVDEGKVTPDRVRQSWNRISALRATLSE